MEHTWIESYVHRMVHCGLMKSLVAHQGSNSFVVDQYGRISSCRFVFFHDDNDYCCCCSLLLFLLTYLVCGFC